jgi:pimeloyl-ACP methyl ester carboxylesterase
MSLAYHRPPPLPGFVSRDVYRNLFIRYKEEKVHLLANLWADREQYADGEWDVQHDILVVWGEKDPLFPVSVGERLVDAIGSRARFTVIPRASHAPNLEKPRLFNKHLKHFLNSEHV